jgi:hypothetical protein
MNNNSGRRQAFSINANGMTDYPWISIDWRSHRSTDAADACMVMIHQFESTFSTTNYRCASFESSAFKNRLLQQQQQQQQVTRMVPYLLSATY